MNALLLFSPLLGETAWLGGLFSGLEPNDRFVLVLVAIGCLTAVVTTTVVITSGVVQSVHRTRTEADLKRDMLDRGMTAEEIAKVIESTPPEGVAERWIANRCKKKSA